MPVKQLSEIWVYPIKSLGGISLQTASVQPKGLQWDRRWMLVDENNQFMTQRTRPEMALFKLSFAKEGIVVHHFSDQLLIPYHHAPSNPIKATIWDDTVEVMEVSTTISTWFSERMKMACRLVAFPEENPRAVDPRYKVNDDHVSLADAYPFLIIGQSSLDELNQRLSEAVPMNRFRPNFVFTGGEAFEEDNWTAFRIGKNKFAGVKNCARCVLTTIDQQTAKKGTEPLATLAGYRNKNGKVLFGQNLIALNYEEVSVGDEIIFE